MSAAVNVVKRRPQWPCWAAIMLATSNVVQRPQSLPRRTCNNPHEHNVHSANAVVGSHHVCNVRRC